MKKVILFVCLFAFLSSLGVVAGDTCTATLDKEVCVNNELITATFVCSAGNERNQAYSVQWWNVTGDLIMVTDNDTTPGSTGESFFESFTCPVTGILDANVTLTGTNLEGGDTFSVVAAGDSDLIIRNITVTDECLLGKVCGFRFEVVDENTKLINNAHCAADIENGEELPRNSVPIETITRDGVGVFSGESSADALEEGRGFVLTIRCDCGAENTSVGCSDEDGLAIDYSSGSASQEFDIATWLTVNTVTDRTAYVTGDLLIICANVTNPPDRERLHITVRYNYRCDSGLDSDLNRVVIGMFEEDRGISSNTTQMQCADLVIPDAHILEASADDCYAETDISVLSETHEFLIDYHTTSPRFNITTNRVHPFVVWLRISDNSYRANVTLEEFDVGVKEVHVIIDRALGDGLLSAQSVTSFSVVFGNGSVIPFGTRMVVHALTLETGVSNEEIMIIIEGVNTSLNQTFLVTVNIQGGDTMQIGAVALAILSFAFFYAAGYFHRAEEMPLRAGSIMVAVLLAANAALVSSVDIMEASPAVTLTIWVIRLALIISFLWVLFRTINTLARKLPEEMDKDY